MVTAPEQRDDSRRTGWIVAAFLAGCMLWLFGRGFLLGELFAYRDSAHFHYPTFTYVNDRWWQGELPLWNPHDNLGQPLAGDPTSTVFYPLRLVAAILPIGAVRQYQAYVLLHLAAALAGTFLLARNWRCRSVAAGTGALAYGFGGAVLSQYCNVIFLVGAAWWPAALAAIEWLRREGSWRASMTLAAVLALMILGGDAEAAYLAMIVAAWRFWWSADELESHAGSGGESADPPQDGPSSGEVQPALPAAMPMLRLLVTTAILAASLAAIQILPSVVALAETGRATSELPRSIYEVFPYLTQSAPAAEAPTWSGVGQGLFGRPAPGAHEEHLYWFSVAPWRVVEAAVPNALGREYPENRRWGAVAEEGGLWSPTLYFGILPLLIGLGSLRCFGPCVRSQWLSWLFLAALVASFGWYGLGWLLGPLQLALGGQESVGPQTGGLYWFMTVFLPGFVQFRYPAKLLVPAMLAMALLVARGWRPAFWQRELFASRLTLLAIAGLGLLVSLVALRIAWEMGLGAQQAFLAAWFDAPLANPLFGPLDRSGAWWDVAGGLLQVTLLCGLVALVLRANPEGMRGYFPLIALALTGIDLVVANGWIIQYGALPREQDLRIAAEIAGKRPAHGFAPRLYRPRGDAWWPTDWGSTRSPDRLAENLEWEVRSLRPKYHLLHEFGAIEAGGPWSRRDYEILLAIAREQGGNFRLQRSFLELLGTDWIIGPTPGKKAGVAEEPVKLTYLPARRAWIASQFVTFPALADLSRKGLEKRTDEVLLEGDAPRDFRKVAVVEGAETFEDFPTTRPEGEKCRLVDRSGERVTLDVVLQAPGLVVLADSFDSGWSVLVSDGTTGEVHEGAIVRVNRVLRGVMLPAGSYRVSFVYQPPAIMASLWISGAAWIFWIAWMAISLRRSWLAQTLGGADQAESA